MVEFVVVCNYLDSVKSSSRVTPEMLARVPADMVPNLDLLDEEFMEMCNAHFDELDVNKDGTLSLDELAPIIVDWVGSKTSGGLSMSLEECFSFVADTFDQDQNGVIDRGEVLYVGLDPAESRTGRGLVRASP